MPKGERRVKGGAGGRGAGRLSLTAKTPQACGLGGFVIRRHFSPGLRTSALTSPAPSQIRCGTTSLETRLPCSAPACPGQPCVLCSDGTDAHTWLVGRRCRRRLSSRRSVCTESLRCFQHGFQECFKVRFQCMSCRQVCEGSLLVIAACSD